jgi:putative resolvase
MSGLYRIGEFAERIGRSVRTVRRWESEGRITVKRTSSGQWYFDDSDVCAVLRPGFDVGARRTVAYCRVSLPGQLKDELAGGAR